MNDAVSTDVMMKIYLQTAAESENETVKSALDNLIVVLRLAENEKLISSIEEYLYDLDTEVSITSLTKNINIDKDAAILAIEDTLERKYHSSLFALDNFLDVWSYDKQRLESKT